VCWLIFDGMAHADIKALLAAGGISLSTAYPSTEESTP
jgi:hypothetical protein